MPPDDPRVRCPDITRAKQILGWYADGAAQGRAGEDDRVLPRRARRTGGCRHLDPGALAM